MFLHERDARASWGLYFYLITTRISSMEILLGYLKLPMIKKGWYRFKINDSGFLIVNLNFEYFRFSNSKASTACWLLM